MQSIVLCRRSKPCAFLRTWAWPKLHVYLKHFLRFGTICSSRRTCWGTVYLEEDGSLHCWYMVVPLVLVLPQSNSHVHLVPHRSLLRRALMKNVLLVLTLVQPQHLIT